MAIFGYNTIGANNTNSATYYFGSYFILLVNGTITDIQVYVQNTDTVSHNIECALYNFGGPGNPTTFIAATQSTAIAPGFLNWLLCPFAVAKVSPAGTYFLMLSSDDTNSTVFFNYDIGAAGAGAYYSPSTYGTWPNLTGICTSSTAITSIFADYIPSAAVPQNYGDGLSSYTC
jgi:hypothetical protein